MTDQNILLYDLTYEWSWCVALVTHARPHRCYSNASQALVLLPDLLWDGHFVEGWMVIEGIKRVFVIEHGWCVKGPHIIDPTWVLLPRPVDQPTPIYVAGVSYTREETTAPMGTCLPHVCCSGHYGPDGMRHPTYQAAYAAAIQQAAVVAQKTIPPKEVRVIPAEPTSPSPQEETTITITVVSSSAFWSAFLAPCGQEHQEDQQTGDMGRKNT